MLQCRYLPVTSNNNIVCFRDLNLDWLILTFNAAKLAFFKCPERLLDIDVLREVLVDDGLTLDHDLQVLQLELNVHELRSQIALHRQEDM